MWKTAGLVVNPISVDNFAAVIIFTTLSGRRLAVGFILNLL